MEFILHNIDHANLLTGLILVSVLLLVLSKYFYTHQFTNFLNLTQFNKYVTLYAKNTTKAATFNWLMYLFFTINSSMFIHLSTKLFQLKTSFFVIFIAVNLYILGFHLIKKICFEILDINTIMSRILFQKITFNHYIGLLLFVFNLISLYINTVPNSLYTYSTIFIVVGAYLLIVLIVVFQNLKWILKLWFYFILYLCTFKISPILIGVFLLSR